MANKLRPFRAMLEDLYIVQDLELEEIREFMRSERSINVGRSSYERLFKEWGLRETTRGENWGWVSHKIHRREQDGRKSALYIDGKQTPTRTLRKEISRHVSTLQQALDRARTAPSLRAPDGYVIATPAPSAAVTTPGPGLTPVTNSDDLDDANGMVSIEAIEHADEAYMADKGTAQIDLQEKTMIVEALQSCGAFIKAWGSSGWSSSGPEVLEMYESMAEGILTAVQSPREHTNLAKPTPFATGFNILLSTYQNDAESVQAVMAMSKTAEYEDVFRAALFLAARKGILNLVEILFDLFAEDPKDDDGQTCLHISSIHNQPHVVEFLLGRG